MNSCFEERVTRKLKVVHAGIMRTVVLSESVRLSTTQENAFDDE